jgi:hypothetical protein
MDTRREVPQAWARRVMNWTLVALQVATLVVWACVLGRFVEVNVERPATVMGHPSQPPRPP